MPIDPADGDDDFVDQWADPDSDTVAAEQPFGDPEESVSIPEAPSVNSYESDGFDAGQLSSDLSDVDSDLLNTFAVSVLLTNAGVLLVSLGSLLIIFRGQFELGGGLIFAGTLALLRVGHHYRAYKRASAKDDSQEADNDSESDSNSNSASDSDADTDSKSASAAAETADEPPEHNH